MATLVVTLPHPGDRKGHPYYIRASLAGSSFGKGGP
jgi:hypothetical protein